MTGQKVSRRNRSKDLSLDRRSILLGGTTFAAAAATSAVPSKPARAQSAAAKLPTEFTKAANRRVLEALPFNDRADFEDAQRGFIAGLPGDVIRNPKGEVIFELKKVQVPTDAPAPDTMNPSLWRISQLKSLPGSSRSSTASIRSATSTSRT
jgi:alkyl sulfatase BDS1-like metallo-beta-lactamase superfamily hydrolase